jgi:hypothetical protein
MRDFRIKWIYVVSCVKMHTSQIFTHGKLIFCRASKCGFLRDNHVIPPSKKPSVCHLESARCFRDEHDLDKCSRPTIEQLTPT